MSDYSRELQEEFMKACDNGSLALVASSLRLKTGSVKVPNEAGFTALHLASISGHLPVVIFLLENGANPLARDKFGKSALDYARLGAVDETGMDILDSLNQASLAKTKSPLQKPSHPNERECRKISMGTISRPYVITTYQKFFSSKLPKTDATGI